MSFWSKKVPWILKTFSGFLPALSGSIAVSENKQKEHEITFHPRVSYENFTPMAY